MHLCECTCKKAQSITSMPVSSSGIFWAFVFFFPAKAAFAPRTGRAVLTKTPRWGLKQNCFSLVFDNICVEKMR